MNETNSCMSTISKYFKTQSQLEQLILATLQNDENTEENFEILYNFVIEHKILQNKKDLLLMLKCLISISNNHQRSKVFFHKIEKIFLILKKEMKESFHNTELFNLFKCNKRIILFLIREKILIPNDIISQFIILEQNPFQDYYSYFTFDQEDENQQIIFDEKRFLGENDSSICEIIRNDLINEFLIFIQQDSESLNQIPHSIFETNSFLLNKSPTLIEYSAFCGSFNIFQYLACDDARLTPSIWIYAIHSRCKEIIHFLEEKQIQPESYEKCFVEAIKCHHNELALYFMQFIDIKKDPYFYINKCIKYYNFFIMSNFDECLNDFYKSCITNSFKKSNIFNTLYQFIQFDYINVIEFVLTAIENDVDQNFLLNIREENKINILKNNQSSFSDLYLRVLNICLNQRFIIDYQNTKISTLEDEKNILTSKNKILLMNNTLIEKKYKKEVQKNRLLLGKLKKVNKNLYELQKKLNELSENKKMDEQNGPLTLTSTIILELIKNEKINIHARKYSDSLKDICFLLFINSNITYNLLRKFIPLPHPDHLRKIYRYNMKIKKENLLNQSQLEFLLHELHKEYSNDENEPVTAALGFDAATIDPRDQGSTGLFVFDSQPVNGQLRSNVVFAKANKNGKANKEIMKTVDDIIVAGEKAKIIFKFIVSDSDSATNQIHIEFYNYISKFKGQTFDDLLEYVGNYSKPIPVSDWLHLLKNLRTRIIGNKIILFKGSDVIDIETIDQILDLEKTVKASRGRATMRDDIALRLINDENLSILAENDQFCCFALMLPFVLFTIAIQSENLSIEARKKLCFLSYDIINKISRESEKLPQQKSDKTEKVAYLLNMMKIRVLNTILAVAFALQNYSEHIMMSRLGTHIIEFIFGRMRNGCNGFDSFDKCIYQLVKSQVTKEILDKYNQNEIPVSGRSHPGGSSFSENWKIEIENININEISAECLKLIHHQIQYDGLNVQKLISFLSNVSPMKIPSLKGPISGTKIEARHINYKNNK